MIYNIKIVEENDLRSLYCLSPFIDAVQQRGTFEWAVTLVETQGGHFDAMKGARVKLHWFIKMLLHFYLACRTLELILEAQVYFLKGILQEHTRILSRTCSRLPFHNIMCTE
jgi:hypothetical protein